MFLSGDGLERFSTYKKLYFNALTWLLHPTRWIETSVQCSPRAMEQLEHVDSVQASVSEQLLIGVTSAIKAPPEVELSEVSSRWLGVMRSQKEQLQSSSTAWSRFADTTWTWSPSVFGFGFRGHNSLNIIIISLNILTDKPTVKAERPSIVQIYQDNCIQCTMCNCALNAVQYCTIVRVQHNTYNVHQYRTI